MRKSHRCPKCEHTAVIHVPVVRDSGYNRLMIVARFGFFGDEEYGEFEAYICRECGYSELYVKGAKTVQLDKVAGATLIEGAGGKSPYR